MRNKQHLSYMSLRDYNSKLTADRDMGTPPYTANLAGWLTYSRYADGSWVAWPAPCSTTAWVGLHGKA